MTTVTIPGQPVAKGRPRFGKGHAYTPGKTKAWEDTAVWFFKMAKATPILKGPIRVDIDAEFKRPQRLMRKKDPSTRMWNCSKPDLDNTVKTVLDAMVKAGVMKDDAQVADLRARSFYCAKLDVPHVRVTWEAIDV